MISFGVEFERVLHFSPRGCSRHGATEYIDLNQGQNLGRDTHERVLWSSSSDGILSRIRVETTPLMYEHCRLSCGGTIGRAPSWKHNFLSRKINNVHVWEAKLAGPTQTSDQKTTGPGLKHNHQITSALSVPAGGTGKSAHALRVGKPCAWTYNPASFPSSIVPILF